MEPQFVGINLEFVFQKIYELIFGFGDIVGAGEAAASFLYIVSYVASAILVIVVIYYLVKIKKLDERHSLVFFDLFKQSPATTQKSVRWNDVVAHITSDNPAQWRVAILEADSMLDEMLRNIGYTGAGVGEMLKQVEQGDMINLDGAWEAHKIRNKIAHDGIHYGLTEAEAHQTINLYRLVFQEFGLI